MKTRSAMLLSALFAAGVLGVNSGVAHADTVTNSTNNDTTVVNSTANTTTATQNQEASSQVTNETEATTSKNVISNTENTENSATKQATNTVVNATTQTANTSATKFSTTTPMVKEKFVGKINYVPGYGVNLWKLNEDKSVSWIAPRRLTTGSTWKVFGYTDVNNNRLYNLGGNQWVDSTFVIEGTSTGKYTVLKDNANSQEYYTSQYNPVFAPWGCASSALSMLMKYDGNWKNVPGSTDAQKLRYMQDHLPQNYYGGQIGNPYTGAGFKSVITSKSLTDYAHSLGDSKIKDISGVSLNTIAKLVESGHPVLYYGWSSYDGGGNKARNHCKVIFGYNPANNTFLVHDPLYQYKYFYRGGGGQREGIYNGYDLGPIAWVSASSINREFRNNALTIQ